MKSCNRGIFAVLLLFGMSAGCVTSSDAEAVVESGAEPISATTPCALAQGMPVGGSPEWVMSPGTTIVSDFTRSIFPSLIRPGGWSSTAQFVADSRGMTLPAVVATSNNLAGWIALPIDATAYVVGVSLGMCNDSTTSISANTWGTQFSNVQRTNATDSLVNTGSIGAGGTPGVWHVVDIGMPPTLFTQGSTFWMDISAMQAASPPPSPTLAISQIVLHLNSL